MPRLRKRVGSWVGWSDVACATLRKPDPMTTSRIPETSANGLAADTLSFDGLASLHLHLEQQLDLERVVGIRDLRFSEF